MFPLYMASCYCQCTFKSGHVGWNFPKERQKYLFPGNNKYTRPLGTEEKKDITIYEKTIP